MRSQCAHLCAKFCILLEDAIRRETAAAEFYRNVIAECDYPEVREYFQRFISDRERTVASLHRKLEELQAGRDITASIGAHLA